MAKPLVNRDRMLIKEYKSLWDIGNLEDLIDYANSMHSIHTLGYSDFSFEAGTYDGDVDVVFKRYETDEEMKNRIAREEYRLKLWEEKNSPEKLIEIARKQKEIKIKKLEKELAELKGEYRDEKGSNWIFNYPKQSNTDSK